MNRQFLTGESHILGYCMRTMMMAVIVAVILAMTSLSLNAETYQGIGPYDTLADVKAKFPNARFVKDNPAWATETEVLYRITGSGLSGTILVMFSDIRAVIQKRANDAKEPASKEEWNTQLANMTDDDALIVKWVRWAPDKPVPLDRVIQKHGKPDKKDITDDMLPIREWQNKGLSALLTDDEKRVIFIQFNFTKEEIRKAWKTKYDNVPK